MNQHYVPRVHLKFFAEKVKNEYLVDVYEKATERRFKTNIKNICSENHFYTLDENQTVANDVLAIENIYANHLEPIYRKAYDLLTDIRINKITHKQHNEILIGIFQMYMRNPRLLKNMVEYHSKEIEKEFENAKSKGIKGLTYLNEDFSFREYSLDDITNFIKEKITKDYKEKHILGTKDICMAHIEAKYEVLEIIDDGEFITGDNPLIYEDQVTKNEHPLLKSKEFTLPLNKKFAIRIFHDNTKKLNYIYRKRIPHGNAGSINDSILKLSNRFIIGTNYAFDELFKIKKYFDDTSIELKMDAVKQIVTKIEPDEENIELHKLMKVYLDKYEKNGLSKIEEYEFFMKIKRMSAEWKKNRIK